MEIECPRHHCSCSPSKSPVSDDVLGVITFWISYHFHTDGRINFANRDRHNSPDRFGANRPKLIASFGNRLIFRCENHKPSPRMMGCASGAICLFPGGEIAIERGSTDAVGERNLLSIVTIGQ